MVIFIFIVGICKRLFEIPLFWESRFDGKWWNEYQAKGWKWNPFRDAYHTFVNVPTILLCIYVSIKFDIASGFYMWLAWALGQWLSLGFRRNN